MVFVPTIIERNASSERVYDLYSCLLKERIIILTGEIDDAMSSSICAQLLYPASAASRFKCISILPAAVSVRDWLFMI